MIRKVKLIIRKNKQLFSILSSIKNYRSNKLKSVYEKIFSNLTGGYAIVVLDNISGEYEIDIRSHILKRILLTKEYEPRITELILENINPNKDAINIGANIGLYTNLLADNINPNRKVLAIEPTPNAFRLLKNNIKRNNNVEKIITFNGIVSDEEGEFEINIVQGKEEYSSIGELTHESVKNEKFVSLKVAGATIDSLVEKHKINPGLLVIDVEGAEFKVLKGAIETIKNYHPIIISELDDTLLSGQGCSSLELINFLKELNYKIIDTEGGNPDYPFSGNIIACI